MKRIKVKREIENKERMAEIPAELTEPLSERFSIMAFHDGKESRREGLPIDFVAMKLLRTEDQRASWRMGWRMMDALLKKKGKKK